MLHIPFSYGSNASIPFLNPNTYGSSNAASDGAAATTALTPAIATDQARSGDRRGGTLPGQARAGDGYDINQRTTHLGPGYVVDTDADGIITHTRISCSSHSS